MMRATVLSLAATAVVLYAADSLHYMNVFADIPSVSPGACRALPGITGPEDMVLTRTDRLLISSDERREHQPYRNGAILAYQLHSDAPPAVVWDGGGEVFHPHGIDYLMTPGGDEYLFVINHGAVQDEVDILRVSSGALELLRRIPLPGVRTLNDLAAVAPDQFYVTADHGSAKPSVNLLADYLRLSNGHVDFFNGNRFVRAASDIAFANGIVLSRDGQRVIVSAMLGGGLISYRRDAGSGELHKEHTIALGGSPDNISMSDDGTLLVGVHSKILQVAKQRRTRQPHAPTVIKQVTLPQSGEPQVRTVYSDPALAQSAGSVAVSRGGELLIGSIYDDHVLACATP